MREKSLSISDLIAIRKAQSVAEVQQFLADRDVPHTEWYKYTSMVGTAKKVESDIVVTMRDPLRSYLWAMLKLNGCSYRMIARYYNINHASVGDAVRKWLPTEHISSIATATHERMEELIQLFALNRHMFVAKSNVYTDAQRLSELG